MINIDPQEIEKFETSASTWWDLDGEFKPLHAINPLRLQFIQQRVELAGKRVIDIGCGGGILTESLAKQGAYVTGIDMSTGALQIAQQHSATQQLTIHYQQITAEEMAAKQPQTYDVVTCMEMLEHVPDPLSIIQACATLVKPNGQVFFSTLNRALKAYLFAILGAEYLLKLLPKGTHDYAKFIRPAELASWARTSGLALQELAGITYNPLTGDYHLTQDVSVNYLGAFTCTNSASTSQSLT